MTRTTDADNLNWYLYLFEYNDTSRIPYKALAKRLGTSQHSLIAKVGRARKHPTMAEALIQQGRIARARETSHSISLGSVVHFRLTHPSSS